MTSIRRLWVLVALILAAAACSAEQAGISPVSLPDTAEPTTSTTIASPMTPEQQVAGVIADFTEGNLLKNGQLIWQSTDPRRRQACTPEKVAADLAWFFDGSFGLYPETGIVSAAVEVSEVEVDWQRSEVVSYRTRASIETVEGRADEDEVIEDAAQPIVESEGKWYLDIDACTFAEDHLRGRAIATATVYWDALLRGDFDALNLASVGDDRCDRPTLEETYALLRPDLRGGSPRFVEEAGFTAWAWWGDVQPSSVKVDMEFRIGEGGGLQGFESSFLFWSRAEDGWRFETDPCRDLEWVLAHVAYEEAAARNFAAFSAAHLYYRSQSDSFDFDAARLTAFAETDEYIVDSWEYYPKVELVGSFGQLSDGRTYVTTTADSMLLVTPSASGMWLCTSVTGAFGDEGVMFSGASDDLQSVDSVADCEATGVRGFSVGGLDLGNENLRRDLVRSLAYVSDLYAASESYVPRLGKSWSASYAFDFDGERLTMGSDRPTESVFDLGRTEFGVDAARAERRDLIYRAEKDRLLLAFYVGPLQGWQCIAISEPGIRYGLGDLEDGIPTFESCWESGSEGYWTTPAVDQARLDALAANWGS